MVVLPGRWHGLPSFLRRRSSVVDGELVLFTAINHRQVPQRVLSVNSLRIRKGIAPVSCCAR
ncbi:MAG: hypothetical protein NT138_11720 [Planctomycetales bacterium]|nr:hypothetical protein [Planctomycetales bacterium]